MSLQVATVTSGIGKEERQWVIAPDHLSEMPALPSITDNQHGWSETSTGLYETLPGIYTYIYKHICINSHYINI